MLTGPVLTLRHIRFLHLHISVLRDLAFLSYGTHLPCGAYPFMNFKFCKKTLKVLSA